jgi:hypothetical protein
MRSFLLILTLLNVGCADIKVSSSQDPNANFDDYTSWCWLNGCTPSFEGPSYLYPEHVLDDLVNAIAVEMDRKGFIQGDDQSDILLNFHLAVVEDSARNALVFEEDLPLWEKYDETELYYHFLKGTLVIDVIDRKKSQIVWRSVTQKYLSKYSNVSYLEMEKGVKKALKDLPSKTEAIK